MEKIAAIIFENDQEEILLSLRDDKPGLPFPHHWNLLGGRIEEGETPEQALVREVKEEIDYDLKEYSFFQKYDCLTGDVHPNIKYIYTGKINVPASQLVLSEGERLQYFKPEEISSLKLANILKEIVMDYLATKT